MSEKQFDMIVIGAGPGGYACAIKAAQLGMKVACIEKCEKLGGTCLNVGCIPSKALLHASHVFQESKKNHLAKLGIEVSGDPKLNMPAMLAFKDKAIEGNTKGIAFLFNKNKITWVKGQASLVTKEAGEAAFVGEKPAQGHYVKVAGQDGEEMLHGGVIVLATGSDAATLPIANIDEQKIVTSTGALCFENPPKRLAVIGGGVIGLELGAVWSRLGTQVTILEFSDRILFSMDKDIGNAMQKILGSQGMHFKTNAKVTQITKNGKEYKLTIVNSKDDSPLAEEDFDAVLIACGRRPFHDNLGLDAVGVAVDARGCVEVNESLETTRAGIYAIGDLIRGPMLAHKATMEGVTLAQRLHGEAASVNYEAIPGVVYTSPEIASVGATSQELEQAGIPYNAGKFPFTANGRAKAMDMTDGFVKILAHKETDRVLGVHIIAPSAGEMIHEAVAIMEFGGSSEDIARMCHAHPTFAEAVAEAAESVTGKPLHM